MVTIPALDSLNIEPFRASYPLAFNLYNPDGHAVLFIADDPGAASLIVDLRNTTAQQINRLNPTNNNTVSAQNYHVQLKFRAGVLSQLSQTKYQTAQAISGWSILGQKDATSEQVTLYLLNTQRTSLLLNEQMLLILPLTAAAGAGARGTQVEMLPNPDQVQFASDGTRISGSQLAHLQIISHQGLRHIPLYVGFVGSNRIMNDGSTPNSLTLELVNLLQPSDRGKGEITLDPGQTRLIIQFMTSPDGVADGDLTYVPWALGTANQVSQIVITVDPKTPDWSNPKLITTGINPQWEIKPTVNNLPPGGTLKLNISGIVSSIRSGLTNLYLAYEKIPGYWEGQFVCEIEKAPLVFHSGNVGIATTQPSALLQVGHSDSANYFGNVTTLGIVQRSSDTVGLSVRKTGANPVLQFCTPDKCNYIEMDKNTGGLLVGSNGFGQQPVLNVGTSNVGVGTTQPSALLQVGNSDSANYFGNVTTLGVVQRSGDTVGLSVRKTGANPVLQFCTPEKCNYIEMDKNTGALLVGSNGFGQQSVLNVGISNVGVGTNNPTEKLTVSGNILLSRGAGRSISVEAEPDNNTDAQPLSILAGSTSSSGIPFLAKLGGTLVLQAGNGFNVNAGGRGGDVFLRSGANWISSAQGQANGGDLIFQTGSANNQFVDRMRISETGDIHIGAVPATSAKLTVTGSGSVSNFDSSPDFLLGNGPRSKNTPLSIYADGNIAAPNFFGFSDQRIKSIQGRSDAASDLSTLLNIEVTDFTYIDTRSNDPGAHKKVIAQQVEKVFPQAVSHQTAIVPDIYQQAAIQDGWIMLANDLKTGEKVKLISDSTEGVFEILAVRPDGFCTDFKTEGDRVFVYGRQVTDFGVVDYDAISMLNVSATQALFKQLEILKEENSKFKARFEAFEKKDALYQRTPALIKE